ncbi:mucin-associated surface protein (MASP) [Trypanosoma cruzi Dm28c]|uniref:Mucin-associated surface protein (MASP) n=2 Tax=Trypanosoma cruzi TaxID=5693 RepID=V5D003_TRYCR|nr:mucin-associated surface protein (MASP) [Trypanosoma cruzi Dm28c]PBJ69576.1 mucin-associated surface protein [Trypanosoma cruzi cruzi]PWU90057.1 Mucin-associated surface protein (MASP) [Trypanosoma cruzi]
MAMMMTGRVLLVCALCVLCCGAGGVYAGGIDNNAVGDCMASEVLGRKTLNTPSGCDKSTPKLPFRSALLITALKADVSEEDGKVLNSIGSSGTGGSSGGGGGGGESVTSNSGTPGSGGGSQLGDVPSNAAPSGGPPPPPPLEGTEDLKLSGVKTSTRSREPQTTIKQSGGIKTPSSTTPPKVEVLEERPKPEAERQVANAQEKDNSQVIGVNASEKNKDKRAIREEKPSTVSSIEITPQVNLQTPPRPTPEVPPPTASPEATLPATGESSPTRNLSRDPTEQTNDNSQSQNGTVPETLIQPSGDAETEQQNQESNTSNLIEITDDDSLAEKTSSSISKNDSDDGQNAVDENNDNSQRLSPKETSDHKADNKNVAPTTTEPAPPTADTATIIQTNDTATTGDSDGSTAASHTTSPLLLLLVVACAAAAAVVAA